MAREKKKETLTPEERLQAALVPDWEQPYKVPENWCWVYAPEIFNIEYGKGLSTKELCETGYPVFGANGQIGFYSEYMFEEVKALMSCRGAYSGTMNLSFPKSFITSNSLIINSKHKDIDVKFIFYLYSALNKKDLITGSAQPQVTVQAFKNYPIPLSPLPEQQRIVDRIESLFAKLDAAKQKAQDALDSFKTRKAALLHKAFTGELTAQWRKEHGVGMESWEDSTVGKICQDIKVGIVIKPSQYYTNEKQGTPAFRSANVRENYIDDFDWVYLNQDGMEKNTRSIVHTGDVLVVRSGNPGTACVVSSKFDGYNAIDILIAVPDHSRVTSEFLCAYTNSPLGKRLITENKRGMALAHFNVKGYSGLPIRVPLLEEQTEIVQCLDNLFSKEQQAKKVTESMLEQIAYVKKSILMRAFRGELGTNDPNEESSVELLKRVLAENKHITTKRRCKSIPVELKNKLETELEQKIIRLYSQQSTKSLPAEKIISVSAKKFEIMEALNNLEKRGIIKKMNNGRYKLLG